jgi:23S rRNA (adenine2503-C2)-methyltransferase
LAARLDVRGGAGPVGTDPRLAARRRYAAFFREGHRGDGTGPDAAPVGPIVGTHLSQSPEGPVLKFTQRVPGRPARPRDAAASDSLPVLGQPSVEPETESVLIPMRGSTGRVAYTLCVSSQVGCAMGCTFCQTAQMGLIRSLSAAEIVGQWFAARHTIDRAAHGLDPAAPIGNIVFMGMGEPMDNLAEVTRAISVLTDQRGPGLPMSRITVSTVGRVDGIDALARRVREPGWHRLRLAVSLNAPSDAVRSAIMPINRAVPLAELRGALLRWPLFGGTHVCLEYVLIPGVNDAPEHAEQVAAFVLGDELPSGRGAGASYNAPRLTAMVNVIPYNPREGSPWPAPEEETVDAFMARVKELGVFVKRRRTKGRDTMAACGQLGNLEYRRRK